MKISVLILLLSTFFTKISVSSSEAAIDDNWANDDIFSNTYSDLDPASTPDDELQGSLWDDNLVTNTDIFTGTLAGADTGCSPNIGPSRKRRRDDYCLPSTAPPSNLRLSLPKSPFEVLEPKDRLNLNLNPIRFPGGAPQLTQMDNIYCGNSEYVVCSAGRAVDQTPSGNGKYRLRNVRRVLQGSLCVSPESIWCCEIYLPQGSSGDGNGNGNGNGNGAQSHDDALNYLNSLGGLNDFGLPEITPGTGGGVQTVTEGDDADSCTYFVTLP